MSSKKRMSPQEAKETMEEIKDICSKLVPIANKLNVSYTVKLGDEIMIIYDKIWMMTITMENYITPDEMRAIFALEDQEREGNNNV